MFYCVYGQMSEIKNYYYYYKIITIKQILKCPSCVLNVTIFLKFPNLFSENIDLQSLLQEKDWVCHPQMRNVTKKHII